MLLITKLLVFLALNPTAHTICHSELDLVVCAETAHWNNDIAHVTVQVGEGPTTTSTRRVR